MSFTERMGEYARYHYKIIPILSFIGGLGAVTNIVRYVLTDQDRFLWPGVLGALGYLWWSDNVLQYLFQKGPIKPDEDT